MRLFLTLSRLPARIYNRSYFLYKWGRYNWGFLYKWARELRNKGTLGNLGFIPETKNYISGRGKNTRQAGFLEDFVNFLTICSKLVDFLGFMTYNVYRFSGKGGRRNEWPLT